MAVYNSAIFVKVHHEIRLTVRHSCTGECCGSRAIFLTYITSFHIMYIIAIHLNIMIVRTFQFVNVNDMYIFLIIFLLRNQLLFAIKKNKEFCLELCSRYIDDKPEWITVHECPFTLAVICWQRTDKVKVKYSQSNSSMYGLFVVIA